MLNVTGTNDCSALSSSFHSLSCPPSFFPSMLHPSSISVPHTPSPLCFPPIPFLPQSLSQPAICWTKPQTDATEQVGLGWVGWVGGVKSQLVTLERESLGIPAVSVRGRLQKHGLRLKGQGVRCLRQPARVCFN